MVFSQLLQEAEKEKIREILLILSDKKEFIKA
jgi:hypothetical protein